jgi:hypothetical protein
MWAAAQNAALHISGVRNTPADSKENLACATKASLPNLVTVRITSLIVVMVLHPLNIISIVPCFKVWLDLSRLIVRYGVVIAQLDEAVMSG